MVPDGWKKESLGDLFDFKNGLNTDKDQYGSGYKFVNVMDIFKNDTLTESKIIGHVQVTEGQLEGYQLKYGDVLFNRTSETFDEIAMTAVYLDEAIATFGGFVIRGRPTGSEVSSDYSPFLFQSPSYRGQAIKLGQGAVRANIGQKDLSKIRVLVPPLSEQKKIAQILSTWDKAIATTEQLLANSQQQKKALMQQLLTGKKRLLDKNGVRYSGEWETYKFGNLFKERVETGRDDLPLLSITADDGVVYQEDTGRKNTSNEDKSKYRRICVNDIGYNTMRMWQGRSSLSDKEGIVSPAYTIVTPTGKVCPAYAAYLFKVPALVHVFYRHSQGLVSDTWNLKFNHFKKISWQVPSIDEQQKIAAVLSTADQKITALLQKIDALKQEKKALMQQLLTGKRRVLVS